MLACIAAFVAGAVFEIYYVAALPVVILFIYVYFYHTEKLFYFLGFATPLSIPVKDIGGGIGLSIPTEPIIFLVFVGMLFKLLKGEAFDRKILTNGLTLVILADLAWMLITVTTSTMPLVSFKYFLARSWFVLVFYLGLTQLFKKFGAIRIFIWCITISTTILVMYTLMVHAQYSFTRTYSYTAMRPFLPDHGMYGAAITFFIPTLLVFGLWGRSMGLTAFGRLLSWTMFVIIVLGVIFSFTRASWLSLAVSFGVMALLILRFRFRTLLVTAGVGIVLFFSFQNTVLNELSRNKQDSDDDIEAHLESFSNVSTDPSNLERLNRWSCAYRMFLDKPVFGFGPGTYTYQYAPYQISSEMSIISTNAGDQGNVHSEYLRPLSEEGAIGGILFLLMVLVATAKGFKIYYYSHNGASKFMALAALLGLLTYFAHAFLNNYSDFDKIAVPMWSMMAILTALESYHMDRSSEEVLGIEENSGE